MNSFAIWLRILPIIVTCVVQLHHVHRVSSCWFIRQNDTHAHVHVNHSLTFLWLDKAA